MANKVTDEQLEKEIQKILKNANLAEISTKKVIQKLEKVFGVELREKKDVIDKFVMDFVNSISDEEKDDDDDDDDDEEEEEVQEEKPKPERKRSNPVKREASPADSEEDNSGDSDWGNKNKRKKATPKPKKAAGKPAAKGGRKGGSGYTRAYRLSPALSDLMGEAEMPRHEVVKRVWAMIKEKNLYDPTNKQFAICDDALLKVIGTKRFRTFGMMKYLKTHFLD